MPSVEITHALSTFAEQKLVLDPARREIVQLSNGEKFAQKHAGKSVIFQPIGADGLTCYALPGKKGLDGLPKARGILYLQDWAAKLGMEKEDLVAALKAHTGNVVNRGVDFVLISSEGQPVLGEAVDSYPDQECMEKAGDAFFCKACEQHIPNPQGWKRHTQGATHKLKRQKMLTEDNGNGES